MKKTFLCLILSLIITSFADAKMLYVDINSNSCSNNTSYYGNNENSPWCGIERAAWGSMTRSSPNTSEAAQAGDTVIVKAGTYVITTTTGDRFEPLLEPANTGTSENPIIFQAENPAAQNTSGYTYVQANGGGSGEPLMGSGTDSIDWIVWDGFYLDARYINRRAGNGMFSFNEADHCTVRRCKIYGGGSAYNPGVGDNWTAVFVNYTTYLTIENNEIWGWEGDTDNSTATTLYSAKDTIFQYNEVHNNGNGFYDKGGNSEKYNTILRYNLFYSNGNGVQTQYHTPMGGTFGIKIYQNIFRDHTNYGVKIHVNSDKTFVVNNTFHGNLNGPSITYPNAQNIIIQNNIVVDTSIESVNAGNFHSAELTINYNNYGGDASWSYDGRAYSYISSWRSAISDEANSTTSDPLFTNESENDFTLQAGSPCKEGQSNDGVDILDLDRDGDTTDSITIGAYITVNEVIGIGDRPPRNLRILPQ